MAVAPNGNLLALIDEKGYMWLGTSDFKVMCMMYVYVYVCMLCNLMRFTMAV